MTKPKKENIICLGVILLLLLFFWSINSFFDFKSIDKCGEEAYYVSMDEFVRQSIKEGEFPHWIPYYYGGTPFFANAQMMYFKLFTLITILTPSSIEANIKIENMLIMLIASISIYFLMLELKVKPKFAIFSVIVYMFNVFPLRRIVYGVGDEFVNAYIWIPLIFLLTLKFIKSKNYKEGILYSILAGVSLALQFHHGYTALFVYTAFLLACFLLIYIILNNFNIKLIEKIIICGLIMSTIFLGLAAIKILPMVEFSKYSSLSGSRTFEDARGSYFEINGVKDAFKPLMFLAAKKVKEGSYDKIAIGIIPIIFLFFSLFKIKNKYVIASFILIIIIFLVATGSPLFYLLWKFFPGFSRQHHIGRILTMVLLPASILVGIGAQTFFRKIEKGFKLNKWILNIAYAIIIVLILINLNYFNGKQYYGIKTKYSLNEMISQNELYQFFANDTDIFRVHNIKDINIGGRAVLFAVPLKQEILMGAVNVWIPEYLNEYFWTYLKFSPYKFLGMLNTKYIYSDEKLSDPALEFVKEFNECQLCNEILEDVQSNDGPYLYYNKLYLPRAYIADKSILVIGEIKKAKEAMYALMIDENFSPSSTVIILKEGLINNQDPTFLRRFKAIILTEGSIDQDSEPILKDYKNSGGILLPDITAGKNAITEEDINSILISKADYKDVKKLNITNYSPNKREIITNNEKGFLVLSEKFFMFEGWKARLNGKSREIVRANGINSAVYIDNPGTLWIEYQSKSFKDGMIISVITLVTIAAYFIFYFLNKAIKKQK